MKRFKEYKEEYGEQDFRYTPNLIEMTSIIKMLNDLAKEIELLTEKK